MSSKRRLRRAERKKRCGNKQAFPSLEAANRACRDLTKKEGHYMSGYKCPFCPGFHFGHTPKGK